MSENPEDRTIRLLYEMQREMRATFDSLNMRIDRLSYIATELLTATRQKD